MVWTLGGVSKFDGTTWKTYLNTVYSIAIDGNGNKMVWN